MKKLKKVISLLLACALLFSLAACGTKNEPVLPKKFPIQQNMSL